MKCFHAVSCFLLLLSGSRLAKADLAPTTLFDVQGSYYQPSSSWVVPTFDGSFAMDTTMAISDVSIVDRDPTGAVLNTYDSGYVVDETGRCDVRPGVPQPCNFTELRFSGLNTAGISILMNLVVELPFSWSSDVPNSIEYMRFYMSATGPMSHADSFGAAGEVFGGAIEGGTITAVPATPEPASIFLLITAAGAAIWRIRRRQA